VWLSDWLIRILLVFVRPNGADCDKTGLFNISDCSIVFVVSYGCSIIIAFDKALVLFSSSSIGKCSSLLSISLKIRVFGRLSILCASTNGVNSLSNWNNGRSFSLALRLRKSFIDERNFSSAFEDIIGLELSFFVTGVESRLRTWVRRFNEEDCLNITCSSSSLVCLSKRFNNRRFVRRRDDTIVLEFKTSIFIVGLDSRW